MAAVEAGRAFVQYGMIDKATENIYIRTKQILKQQKIMQVHQFYYFLVNKLLKCSKHAHCVQAPFPPTPPNT